MQPTKLQINEVLRRQTMERAAAAADAGKVWWRYRASFPRRDIPPWLLYQGGNPEKVQKRANRGLTWLAAKLQTQDYLWPPNTVLAIDDTGRDDVNFELLGWREKGMEVCVKCLDGSTLFDTRAEPQPIEQAMPEPEIMVEAGETTAPTFEPALPAEAGARYARMVVDQFLAWRNANQ